MKEYRYSFTVCLLRCRRSPTSGFVRPSATSRTTLSSWPLSFGSSVLRASISTAAARGSITLSPASTRSIARPRSRSSASVTRKPRAPESSAASTALSSRSAESTMTAVPGCRFRIAAQTSAPEPSGSRESSSTTSGDARLPWQQPPCRSLPPRPRLRRRHQFRADTAPDDPVRLDHENASGHTGDGRPTSSGGWKTRHPGSTDGRAESAS